MTLNAFAFLCLTALFTAVSNLLVRSSLARVADFSPSRAGVLNLIREPMFLAAGLLFTTATLMWFRAVSRNSIWTVLSPLRGPHLFLGDARSILLSR